MEIHFTDDSNPPDIDPIVTEPLTTDTRFSCEVCGTPLTYAGKGRYPKYCNEHKPKPPSQGGTGTSIRATNVDTLIGQMTELYQAVGMGLSFVPPLAIDGMTVTAHSVQLAESWRPLIQRDPKIRKFWEKVCTGGGWGTVLMAHSVVVLAIMQAHDISLPGMKKQEAENV